MYASSQVSSNQYETFRIDFPLLKGHFTGTGDSFSALILAWFHKDKNLIVCLLTTVCSLKNLFDFLLIVNM